MATATLPVSNDTQNDALSVKTENVTYRVYAGVDADGNLDEKSIKITSREKAWEELDKNPAVTKQIEQPFKFYTFGSVQAFLDTITDTEAQLARVNAGCGSFQNSKINSLLKEIKNGDFVLKSQEEAYDLLPYLQDAPGRTSMSPVDKAVKTLQGLDPETRAAIIAALQQGI